MNLKNELLTSYNLDSSNCWNWKFSKDSNGYGFLFYNSKLRRVHRLAAHLFKNLDLDSKVAVLHTCDNPSCYNPEHLFLGNQSDNMKDMHNKRRHSSSASITCIRGHLLEGDNLYLTPAGRRNCKECRRTSARESYRRHSLTYKLKT